MCNMGSKLWKRKGSSVDVQNERIVLETLCVSHGAGLSFQAKFLTF